MQQGQRQAGSRLLSAEIHISSLLEMDLSSLTLALWLREAKCKKKKKKHRGGGGGSSVPPSPPTMALHLGGISSSVLSVFFTDNCYISYWNPCIWLAESKFVSEKHWQNAWWNAPLITLISHKPWVPYYQTQLIHLHMENIPKLTLDLWPTHLDRLHRYDPQSIIKIPTKLYHNWTLLPGV